MYAHLILDNLYGISIVMLWHYDEARARIQYNTLSVRRNRTAARTAKVQGHWIRWHVNGPVIGAPLRKGQPKDLTLILGRELFDIIPAYDKLWSRSYLLYAKNFLTIVNITYLGKCLKVISDEKAEYALLNDTLLFEIIQESFVPEVLRRRETDEARGADIWEILRLENVEHFVLVAAAADVVV